MKEEKEKETDSQWQCCKCTCTSIFSSEEDMERLREKFVKISQALLAWLVLLILSPILLLVFGSLFLWKYGAVWVIVKLFKRKFLKGFEDSEGLFAIDRFWESSKSSLGLIVELEGTINVDTFRDEFRKKLLDYSPSDRILQQNGFTSSSSFPPAPKPFTKLTQIPSTFCGYYFWQKANYFLIHEHIRQINQPTDELGLKKAVGTLMSLPFPNRRPLWEILVYSNYLGTTTLGRGTTCGSALFIRIHRSVTDSEGLMNILKHMLNTSSLLESFKSIQIPSISIDPNSKLAESTVQKGGSDEAAVSQIVLKKFTNLVYFPLRTFQFAQNIISAPKGIATSEEAVSAQSTDSANASWAILSHSMIRKICLEQSPQLNGTTVEMTLFLEGITSRSKHKCLNVPEEKGLPATEGKCQMRVLIPIPVPHENHPLEKSYSTEEEILTNQRSFVTVTCPCAGAMQTSSSKVKMAMLRTIQNEMDKNNKAVQNANRDTVVKTYLKLLGLLPRHLLRYFVLTKRWGAGCFLYEQFHMELPQEKVNDLNKGEMKLFGLYRVSQVIPLVGLQWPHTVASVATLKLHEENVIMSLIANSAILGPVSQANPQEHAERIVRGFPEELERLAEDSEDHGFVSIPIQ